MKKLFLVFSCCLFIVTGVLAQAGELERKLAVKELPTDLLLKKADGNLSKLDCNCSKSLIADPGFTSVTTDPGSSNISASSSPWKKSDLSPQYTAIDGACDKGFVSMWGNNTVGETITQNTVIPAGTYTVKFNARYINTAGPHNPYVQLRIASGTSRAGIVAGTSANISNTAWDTYTMTITLPATTALALYPVNDNTQNDGGYVSWIQLDNICIQKKDPCAECPVPNTNVSFTLSTTLGGGTTATVSALGASTSLGNGWTLKQVACGSANPCKWMPGSIKWQSTGSSITIPASVLTPGCYVLTHYVNKCSKKWDPKQCVSYRSICFTVCDNSIKASADISPLAMKKMQGDTKQSEEEKEAELINENNNN